MPPIPTPRLITGQYQYQYQYQYEIMNIPITIPAVGLEEATDILVEGRAGNTISPPGLLCPESLGQRTRKSVFH